MGNFIGTACLALLACCCSLQAHGSGCTNHIQITDAWARATPPGAAVGVVYLRIVGACAPDRLVSAASRVSRKVEVHQMQQRGSMMQMRQVETLKIPAAATLEFAPGGLHLMLVDLRQPLVEHETLALDLVFEHSGPVSVVATIGSIAAQSSPVPKQR